MKKWNNLVGGLCLLALLVAGAAARADEGNVIDEDEITAFLDNEKPPSFDTLKKQMAAAIREVDPVQKRAQLSVALASVARCQDIVMSSRELQTFLDALSDHGDPEVMRSYVPRLLAAQTKSFDPGASAKLNVGVRLAFAVGGASLDELKGLLVTQADQVDVEWLLPAIGKIGGAQALPILRPYCQDASIVPVNSSLHIQRVPCAAVLGCAYAGDTNAFEKVLQWYEQDYVSMPQLAFGIAWAKQEGMKPDYVLLDYCQHRINQAERLLRFVEPQKLPDLIARANRDVSRSLTTYLFRRLETAPAADLPRYAPLLDHPCILMKRQVLDKLLASGNETVRQEAQGKVKALLQSGRGDDRFFAAEALWQTDPKAHRSLLEAAARNDPSESVRRRLENLATRRVL